MGAVHASAYAGLSDDVEVVGVFSRNQERARHFIDCIAGKADPALLDADRAIEALVLSEATERALAENRTIDLAR